MAPGDMQLNLIPCLLHSEAKDLEIQDTYYNFVFVFSTLIRFHVNNLEFVSN